MLIKNNKNIEHKIISSVSKVISFHNMLQSGDKVLVGVSGGPDSVALLHILLKFTPDFFTSIGIAHLNHSLRKHDSDNDVIFVKNIADELKIPYFTETKNTLAYQRQNRLCTEEAARQVRYNFLIQTAENNRFNKIATGHHADDNAELVLMYLLRGSGLSGLSGIPPVRTVLSGNIQIIRPLINLTKLEIIDFLREKKLTYIIDKSNKDTKYLRNKIRHYLLPSLAKNYNPGIFKTLNRTSVIARSEEEWINNEIIEPLFEKVLLKELDNKIILSVEIVASLHNAAKRRIIRKSIKKVKKNLRRITFHHVESVLSLLEKKSYSWSIDLPDQIRIKRKHNFLSVSKEKKSLRSIRNNENSNVLFEYKIDRPTKESACFQFIKEISMLLKFSEIKAVNLSDFHNISCETGYFDMELLIFPLMLQNIMHGDRFSPLGLTGTQKIKKYCIDNKIERIERNKIPILSSKGKIIWVVGHRTDNWTRITPSTRTVLKAEIIYTS